MPAVGSPNLGLIFNKPPMNIPPQGLRDGKNFRVKNGTLDATNLGWQKFSTNWVLNGKVLLIDNFFPRGQVEKLIFGSPTDLYQYDPNTDTIKYITPAYVVGTASASGTAVTGIGTLWNTAPTIIKAGDKIAFGSATQNSTTATYFTVQSVTDNTHLVLTATAGVIGAGPYTIRRIFTSAVKGFWDTDTFLDDGASGTDLWFATNGIDSVVTWNGTDTFAILHPELGFICQTLKTYSNMMIYGNVTQGGQNLFSTIINSDVGLPLHAGSTGTGLSEQFVTHSHADPILLMLNLGDYMIIYCERIIVPVQFVGDPTIFVFRVAVTNYGPISRNAVSDFGDYHEFIGADAGYSFDGSSLKEINNHVWREILRQTDPTRRNEVFQHLDEEQGDQLWVVPNNSDAGVGVPGASPEIAWVEHYLEIPAAQGLDATKGQTGMGYAFQGSPFSKRTFKFTCSGYYQRSSALTWAQATQQWQQFNFAWNDQFFQSAFPLNLVGASNGQIYTLNQTQTGDGAALPSFVRTGRFALSDGKQRNLLTRVYPGAHQVPFNLEVTLMLTDFLGMEPTSKGTALFSMLPIEGLYFVTFYRRGRAAELIFGSSLGQPWTLDGWDHEVAQGGGRR